MLLERVEKPVRYMGGEFGCTVKDPSTVDVRYAFLFPDTYEVGMSHLGMKILYHAINAREDALCERVFSPWVDMAALMRAENMPCSRWKAARRCASSTFWASRFNTR